MGASNGNKLVDSAAWSGGAIVIAVGLIEHAIGRSLSWSQYAAMLVLAVMWAQFWHGLMQFRRMQPRFEIRYPKQHFWGESEQRGSTGTGWYFEVFNPSSSETLEYVRAELISMDPPEIGVLPFALHIRNVNYCIPETFINPRCSRGFDLATGPDHNTNPQRVIVIPCVMGGDRGYVGNGASIPYGRYRLDVRVSARNCHPVDASFDVWVEDDLLRCSHHLPSSLEAL